MCRWAAVVLPRRCARCRLVGVGSRQLSPSYRGRATARAERKAKRRHYMNGSQLAGSLGFGFVGSGAVGSTASSARSSVEMGVDESWRKVRSEGLEKAAPCSGVWRCDRRAVVGESAEWGDGREEESRAVTSRNKTSAQATRSRDLCTLAR